MVGKVENGVVAIIELEVVDIVGIKAVGTVEVSMADCGGTNIAGIRKIDAADIVKIVRTGVGGVGNPSQHTGGTVECHAHNVDTG